MDVLNNTTAELIEGDTLEWAHTQPDNSVDLVFCSPPYEAARTYGIGFNLRGQAWVDWAVERFVEHSRICRGLVCWVVEGQTKQFRWSAAPALLMADLHRRGIKLRKPPIYRRIGIPGSGGPDWLRNDYELIVCASKGRLPFSDNTAMGHPPKCPPGGAPSHHSKDGRVNKLRMARVGGVRIPKVYKPPVLSNPGNIINCGVVGGGAMGSDLAHENEAPFPEKLAEFFIRSFCPPGGIVYDGFTGSGTTGAVAKRTGRRFIGTDVRASQIELTRRRLAEVQLELIA